MGPTRLAAPQVDKKRKRANADFGAPVSGPASRSRDLSEFDSDVSSEDEGNLGDGDRVLKRSPDAAELADAPEDPVPSEEEDLSDGNAGEEEQPEAEAADPGDDYATAFAKIMTRRLAPNAPGPILSAKQSLLASKLAEDAAQQKASSAARQEKREVREKNHVLPTSHTDAYERSLIKVATKGVVRLFNAVSKAQKMTVEGPQGRNDQGKSSSAALVAELRGAVTRAPAAPSQVRGAESGPVNGSNQPAAQGAGANGTQTWGVLQDKFDLGRTGMKHWDAQDGGDSDEAVEGIGSEDDDDDDDN